MLIALPSDDPGGLEAPISEHFGHCATFTLVELADGKTGAVKVVPNTDHEQGGCMAPVMFLKQHDVDVLLADGMGNSPLAGFQQVGIAVYSTGDAKTVGEAITQFSEGGCEQFGPAEACGDGCDGHHHHHEPIEREPIEGKADVQDGRVVTFDYKLTDSEGTELDSSDDGGPMKYLHGHSNIVPGLEKALTGLEAGAHVVVEVPAADAYGDRDESRIIEVPPDQLPPDITVGAMLNAQTEEGGMLMLTLVELDEKVARLDANHPLAGKDLVFDVTIVKVEASVAEEITHGHVLG